MERSLSIWELNRKKTIIFANCKVQCITEMRLYLNYVIWNKTAATVDKNRMTDIKRELYALAQKGESAEIEFKSARGGFPGSFWES